MPEPLLVRVEPQRRLTKPDGRTVHPTGVVAAQEPTRLARSALNVRDASENEGMNGSPEDDAWNEQWLLRLGAAAPAYWGAVAEMQLRRVAHGADAVRRGLRHPERVDRDDGFSTTATSDFGPIEADTYLLIIAVRHLLALSDRYAERFDATQVGEARQRFDREAPDAKALRDVLAHIDEYALGCGQRKNLQADGQWFIQVGIDPVRDEFDVRAGRLHVELRRTVRAAIRLAETLTEIAAADRGGAYHE